MAVWTDVAVEVVDVVGAPWVVETKVAAQVWFPAWKDADDGTRAVPVKWKADANSRTATAATALKAAQAEGPFMLRTCASAGRGRITLPN